MTIKITKDLTWYNPKASLYEVLVKKNSLFEFENPLNNETMLINNEKITAKQYGLIHDYINQKIDDLVTNQAKHSTNLSQAMILKIINDSFVFLRENKMALEPFTPMIKLIQKTLNFKKYFNII